MNRHYLLQPSITFPLIILPTYYISIHATTLADNLTEVIVFQLNLILRRQTTHSSQ